MIRLLFLAALTATTALNAQTGIIPPGWAFPDTPEAYELETFDHHRLLQEDTRIEDEGGRTNHGRVVDTQFTLEDHAEWNTLPNGDQVIRMRFHTNGAAAVAAFFDNYHIPVGAYLFAYDATRTWVEGPYDHTENAEHGIMTTAEVPGDDLVLEIYMPVGVVGTPTLGVRGVGHFYRYVYFHQAEERGGSDPCEVDVNCPEGEPWGPLRDSVVRLRIVDGNQIGLCSGVLVNTTAADCRRYMLTALHCAQGVSDADFLSLQVRFNYEKSGCGTGAAPSSRNRNGVFHLADSNDGGGNSGSDFLLVELEDEIPQNWNPFFAGWDASGAGSSEGVCIHHPAGDVKKISTYDDNLTSVWFGAPGSHWEVRWVETETNHGVTEGGSSGSPIFNEEGLILGNLTGGTSFCTAPNAPDYYGRMSHHWDSNPNPSSEKLKEWLDPDDTGAEIMFGGYQPNCDQDAMDVPEFNFQDVRVFPSPATTSLQITVYNAHEMNRVDMYDAQGRFVRSELITDNTMSVDVSSMAPGLYHFTFVDAFDQQVTHRVVIQ